MFGPLSSVFSILLILGLALGFAWVNGVLLDMMSVEALPALTLACLSLSPVICHEKNMPEAAAGLRGRKHA